MKLDLDLAGAILAAIEADDEADGITLRPVRIEGVPDRTISYHVGLLAEVGLIAARCQAETWWPLRLTWQGHEALASMRRVPEALEREELPALAPREDDRPTGAS